MPAMRIRNSLQLGLIDLPEAGDKRPAHLVYRSASTAMPCSSQSGCFGMLIYPPAPATTSDSYSARLES